jgi:hypothetical protein
MPLVYLNIEKKLIYNTTYMYNKQYVHKQVCERYDNKL